MKRIDLLELFFVGHADKITFGLIIVLLFSCFLSGNAVEIEDGAFTYDVNYQNNTAILVKANRYITNTSIPPSITVFDNGEFHTLDVIGIGDNAFQCHNNLMNIDIPQSVKTIGNYAFDCCPLLESLNLPNSVTSIGNYAVAGCPKLTSFTFPESVVNVGSHLFSDCDKLNTIIFHCPVIGNWLNKNEKITTIELGDEVKCIGTFAFYCCTGLKNVSIPQNVETIEPMAFYVCTGLQSITIPNNVKTIGKNSFSNCSNLTSAIIGNGVSILEEGIFEGCWKLTNVQLTESITHIQKRAFANCTALESIVIPDGTYVIGEQAFSGCKKLKNVTLGSNVRRIQPLAFQDCAIYSLFIPKYTKKISLSAFAGCPVGFDVDEENSVYDSRDNCHSIVETATNTVVVGGRSIPESAVSIGDSAFYYRAITSISIPPNVSCIGDAAFLHCEGLKDVYCYARKVPKAGIGAFDFLANPCFLHVPSSLANTYKVADGWEEFDDVVPITVTTTIKGITYLADPDAGTAEVIKNNLSEYKGDIVIPSTIEVDGITCHVVGIADEVFAGSDVTSVVISEGITFIGNSVFSHCKKLKQAYLPTTLRSIGNSAFWACLCLDFIRIPEGVEELDYWTFSECQSLRLVTFPSSIKSIGSLAFTNCCNLQWIDCCAENVPETKSNAFDGCNMNAELSVPRNSVESYKSSVPWNKFKYIGALPQLKYVVNGAIYKQYSLAPGTAIVPEPEPTKEGHTFSGWSGIPEWMPVIDVTVTGTFSVNQYKLTYILDGKKYKSYEIDYNAPISLESVPVKKGMTFSGWGEMPEKMPAHDVTLTGSYNWSEKSFDFVIYQVTDTLNNYASVIGFDNISGDVDILPVVEIGGYIYAINSIRDSAFSDCSSMTSIDIPDGVASIGENAFSGCTAMIMLVCHAATPPVCGPKALDGIDKWHCTLVVPVGYIAAYQQAGQWKEFFFIQEDQDDIEGVKAEIATKMDCYDVDGRKLSVPQKGINIIRYSDGSRKKVLVR